MQILQASLLLIWTTERLAYLMQLGGVIIADSSIKKYLQDICFDHNPRTAAECGCGAPYDLHAPPKGVEARRLWLKALNLKKPPKFPYVCSFHFVDGRPTEIIHSPRNDATVKTPRRHLVRIYPQTGMLQLLVK